MTAPATPPRLPAPTAARGCKLAGCGCIGLLLLPVLLLAGYLLWFNRLPPPVVDRRVLPRPNGFDAVVAAVKRLKPAPKDSPIHQRTAPPEDIRRALIPDRDALNAVRKAMRLEYLTPAARDFWELLPYLAQYRDASRKFAAESRLALADGKPGPAVERALDAVELGSLAGRGGGVLHNLIAAALTTIGVPQAEQLVRQLSAAEARAAGRRLDRIMPQFPVAADVIREERRVALASLRGVFSGEIRLDDLADGEESEIDRETQQTLSFLYPKSWSYSEADRAFLATIREMEKPYPQRKPVRHPNEPMAKILVPVGETLGVVLARKDAYLRLLRLELALQEYRKRHGRYPATLAQLSPEIMTAVPLDPFTERPLVYRPQGSAYSLYSLGPDQRDDGGIPAPPRNLGPKTHGDFVAGRLGPQRIGAPPAPPPRRATQ